MFMTLYVLSKVGVGLHEELSGGLLTRLTNLSEMLLDCVQLSALHFLTFLCKNIHNFLFGKRKITRMLFRNVAHERMLAIFCQVR